MSVLQLLDQLCLRYMHRLLFQEVMVILLEVTFLLPGRIFLLMEHIFLLMECRMGCLMDLIMGHSMDRVIHLMGMGINNPLNLRIMAS